MGDAYVALPPGLANVALPLLHELRHLYREVRLHRLDRFDPLVGAAAAAVVDVASTPRAPTVPPADIALAYAAAEWRKRVVEPPTGEVSPAIDEYIRGELGLTWPSVEVGLGARPNQPYRRDVFAWCGAFVARCYGAAGLKRTIRQLWLASGYRIFNWARNTPRWVVSTDILPGDIVVMGPEGDPDGAHMGIARGPVLPFQDDALSGVVETYEGNAWGELPDGTSAEGVVRRARVLHSEVARRYSVRFGVRPLPEDFD